MLRRFAITIGLLLCIIASSSEPANAQRRRRASTISSDAVARRIAAQYWSKYLIKCGGSYFLFSDDRLFEFRDKPQFGFSGQALSPKPLSRTEILNGVDPLPVEWEGNIGVNFNVCRMNTAYYSLGGVQTFWHGWGAWNSQSCMYNTKLTKAKGKWSFFQPKVITCDQLSKWGFVFIPEGVRGAAAERRAEYNAETTAMRKDASNYGIYISDNPLFPTDYFRSLYIIAKRDGLYKTKFFPNRYYAIWNYQGYDYNHKFPDEMESAFRSVIKNGSHALREAEITSAGRWIVIASGAYVSGDFYDYAAKNIPQSMIDAIEELKRESHRYYSPYMDKDHSPRWITFGPNNSWVILYGVNGWKCQCSSDLSAALHQAEQYQIKQVAFHPNGGWLILYADNAYLSNGLSQDLLDKLKELKNANQRIDQVIFMPNGSWAIAGKFSMSRD